MTKPKARIVDQKNLMWAVGVLEHFIFCPRPRRFTLLNNERFRFRKGFLKIQGRVRKTYDIKISEKTRYE